MVKSWAQAGADLGIPSRVGTFCLLISNFNTYNTKKAKSHIHCLDKQKVTNKMLIIVFYNCFRRVFIF